MIDQDQAYVTESPRGMKDKLSGMTYQQLPKELTQALFTPIDQVLAHATEQLRRFTTEGPCSQIIAAPNVRRCDNLAEPRPMTKPERSEAEVRYRAPHPLDMTGVDPEDLAYFKARAKEHGFVVHDLGDNTITIDIETQPSPGHDFAMVACDETKTLTPRQATPCPTEDADDYGPAMRRKYRYAGRVGQRELAAKRRHVDNKRARQARRKGR